MLTEASATLLEAFRASTSSRAGMASGAGDDHAARVRSHLATGAVRAPGESVVRIVDDLDHPLRVRVEVVVDDMPFLVESLLTALVEDGHTVRRVAHPLLAVRRDAEGGLLEASPASAVSSARATRADHNLESWICLDVDGPVDGGREALEARTRDVLSSVRTVVSDWEAMTHCVLEIAAQLRSMASRHDDRRGQDAATFLEWLVADRFTFLGYVEVMADGTRASQYGLPFEGPLNPAQEAIEEPLAVDKDSTRVGVHRAGYPDLLTIRLHDSDGRPVRTCYVLGHFTRNALDESVRRAPIVASRIADLQEAAGLLPGSHSSRELLGILDSFPLDELLQAPVEHLLAAAHQVLAVRTSGQSVVLARHRASPALMTCLVFIPREELSAAATDRVAGALRTTLGGTHVDVSRPVAAGAVVRLRVDVGAAPGDGLREVEVDTLTNTVRDALRTWVDDLVDESRDSVGEVKGPTLVRRWLEGLAPTYRASVDATTATRDLARAERLLTTGGVAFDLEVVLDSATRDCARLRVQRTRPTSLGEMLPHVARLGLEVVDEISHVLTRDDGQQVWIHDIGVRLPGDVETMYTASTRSRLQEAITAAWDGTTESDALSALVLSSGLRWTQVAAVRALVQYLRQTGLPYTLDYVAEVLAQHGTVTGLIVDLLERRTDPTATSEHRQHQVETIRNLLNGEVESVNGRDVDRILRALQSTVEAVLRTNLHVKDAAGQPPQHLAFKLDPSRVLGIPQPVPTIETWVHGPRVEGVHMRFGAVSRGGLRWSDRREDFRTEVLGLVKAQVVKNSVIVPTGAKGGFYAKQLPDPTADPLAFRAEGQGSYEIFVAALLGLADDIGVGPDGEIVVPPAGIVRHDGDDPYLVVAADKGTATFSDVANAVALERGFWLGDAFASGGSVGYDHKAMGITARGAWESVRRHFRELGVDPDSQDVTAVGIGDMSGDVFGNGLLLSRHLRLVAAFDHRHVFLDPDPVAAVSYSERARLFRLERSSWADYDLSLVSAGGGVFSRHAKSIPLSPQVRERLGIGSDVQSVDPETLIKLVLEAPVDLLWNGGVGTYVKASHESHADVGDRVNDGVRVDASRLRVRAVAEGGNLGLTQAARVEAARAGVLLNNDATDNSAGVDCSDHEVNIKILLSRALASGRLAPDERPQMLADMTDDVARKVLANNDAQNRVLSTEGLTAGEWLGSHRRFMEHLLNSGRLDARLDYMPDRAELNRRAQAGAGYTVPELALLLAHAKISLAEALDRSTVPDERWTWEHLTGYFPRRLSDRYPDEVRGHPLAREIISTRLTNEVVALGGITYAFRAAEETGSSLPEVARAYAVVSRVFAMRDLQRQVDALDHAVSAATQALLRREQQRLLDRATRWLLRERPEGIDVDTEVNKLVQPLSDLANLVPSLLQVDDRSYADNLTAALLGDGVPADLAKQTSTLLYVFPMLDVIEIGSQTGVALQPLAELWFLLSERYGFDALLTKASALPRGDRWDVQARATLRDDLYATLRQLTTVVAAYGDRPYEAIARWEEEAAEASARALDTVDMVRSAARSDLTVLSVATKTLRSMIDRAAAHAPQASRKGMS